MRFKVWLILLLVPVLSGCATMQKKQTVKMQMQELQTRADDLEGELQRKQDTIASLEKELAKSREEEKAAKGKPAGDADASAKVTAKNIQTALKNANLYNGQIDGKIGKNTRSAIKEFQRLNGLKVDGIVGKKTWAQLKEFLY